MITGLPRSLRSFAMTVRRMTPRNVCRILERQFLKYRTQVRYARRWLMRGYYAFLIIFFGLGAVYAIAPENVKVRIESGADWLFSQWLFQQLLIIVGIVAVFAGSVFLLWISAMKISTYKKDRAEEKVGILKEAMQPVAAWSEIALRFVTVFLGVWVGLYLAQIIALRFGICLISVNGGTCTYTSLTGAIITMLSVVGALAATWNMLNARHARLAARQRLKFRRMSIIGRILDVIKMTVIGVFGVVLIIILVTVGMIWFGYV